MNWYIAKIVFRICSEESQRLQFDEHIRLISADNFDEAFLKARILGIREEDAFVNAHNKPVKWEFINVADISPLDKLEDGTELTSRLYEMEEAHEHIHYVHQKAITLRLNARPLF